ncbi:hypothetical protein GGR57DRAFT_106062 [Xylariaceae sp. FL1272]|nr:hypothetical protein GGR57DRAFT_106062 [Xylariaceae sp. FL1272]
MRVAPLAILALVVGAVIGDDMAEIDLLTNIEVGDHLDQGSIFDIKWDPNGVTGTGYLQLNSWNMSSPTATYETDLVSDDLDMGSGKYSWTVEPSTDRYTDNWLYTLTISYNSGRSTADFNEFLITTFDALLSSSASGTTPTSTTASVASTTTAETSITKSGSSTTPASTETDTSSTSHTTSAAQPSTPSSDSGVPETTDDDNTTPINRGTIIGAAVGGIVGVLTIIALSFLVFYYRRKSRKNEREPNIPLTARGEDRDGDSNTVTANGSIADFGAGADAKAIAKSPQPGVTVYYELDARDAPQQMDAGWQPPELASRQIAAELYSPLGDPDTTPQPGSTPLLKQRESPTISPLSPQARSS